MRFCRVSDCLPKNGIKLLEKRPGPGKNGRRSKSKTAHLDLTWTRWSHCPAWLCGVVVCLGPRVQVESEDIGRMQAQACMRTRTYYFGKYLDPWTYPYKHWIFAWTCAWTLPGPSRLLPGPVGDIPHTPTFWRENGRLRPVALPFVHCDFAAVAAWEAFTPR